MPYGRNFKVTSTDIHVILSAYWVKLKEPYSVTSQCNCCCNEASLYSNDRMNQIWFISYNCCNNLVVFAALAITVCGFTCSTTYVSQLQHTRLDRHNLRHWCNTSNSTFLLLLLLHYSTKWSFQWRLQSSWCIGQSSTTVPACCAISTTHNVVIQPNTLQTQVFISSYPPYICIIIVPVPKN